MAIHTLPRARAGNGASAHRVSTQERAKYRARPAPASGDYVESPINIINAHLNDAHASLDSLYTLANQLDGDTGLELCEGTLCALLDGAMRRIMEAKEVAEKWNQAAREQRT
jgi:hypothetical protein